MLQIIQKKSAPDLYNFMHIHSQKVISKITCIQQAYMYKSVCVCMYTCKCYDGNFNTDLCALREKIEIGTILNELNPQTAWRGSEETQ